MGVGRATIYHTKEVSYKPGEKDWIPTRSNIKNSHTHSGFKKIRIPTLIPGEYSPANIHLDTSWNRLYLLRWAPALPFPTYILNPLGTVSALYYLHTRSAGHPLCLFICIYLIRGHRLCYHNVVTWSSSVCSGGRDPSRLMG